jgi:putative AlgH/UPF0301 family transcriptional regulator
MAHLFPEFAPAARIADTMYMGGHNFAQVLFALARAAERPSERSVAMLPGVWLVPDATAIDAIIEATPNEARYFIGCLMWAPGRLHEEIQAGMLTVLPADAAKLFLPDTSKLYDELAPAAVPAGGRRI